jgi:predicted aldo/keto reductase-like oxidoreductase
MKGNRNEMDRRNFLKAIGAAGLGSAFADCKGEEKKEPNAVDPNAAAKPPEPKYQPVPRRKLGKSGIEVPVLVLGTNRLDNQIILANTTKWGVNFWDTAPSYLEGNSELTIGAHLAKNPDVRKDLFLTTKASGATNTAQIEEQLEKSLKKMNTTYIDLYYGIHQCSDPAKLTDEIKQWAQSAKKRKLIRFFGFTTHKNMDQVLSAAAKLDWIDAIMTVYNFRLMQDPKMQTAIDACHKAGIGLIAMKTQGLGQKVEPDKDKELIRHFLDSGFTAEQAKIKLVLQDERISSACVGMNNVNILDSNVAAVLDKTKLTDADKVALMDHANATSSSYCAGCSNICNAALSDAPCISDVMRYLMYNNSYGEHAAAKKLFNQIPENIRHKLLALDYRFAEANCPQHLPIGKFVAEAVEKLA